MISGVTILFLCPVMVSDIAVVFSVYYGFIEAFKHPLPTRCGRNDASYTVEFAVLSWNIKCFVLSW